MATTSNRETSTTEEGDVIMEVEDEEDMNKGGSEALKAQERTQGDFLVAGEVIALMNPSSESLYIAFKANPLQEIFDFVLPNDIDCSREVESSATQLIVERSGPWVGFRSVTAGGRMLQAKRKGLNKLCFFQQNFGTYEQWECMFGEESLKNGRICLRNRRLPSFNLDVVIIRIRQNMKFLTRQNSFRVSEPESVQNQGSALKAISGALIKEWAAFVLKEVKARQGLEGQLLELHSEFGQIKMWLVSQLDILRKEAKEGASEVVKEFNLRQLEMADNMNFQHLEILLRTALRRRESQRVASSFVKWQTLMEMNKSMRYARQRFERGRLQQRLCSWRSLTTRNITQREVYLSSPFHCWQKVCQQSRRKKAAAIAKGRVGVLRQARTIFKEWFGHTVFVSAACKEAGKRYQCINGNRQKSSFYRWKALCEMLQTSRRQATSTWNQTRLNILTESFVSWAAFLQKARAKKIRLEREDGPFALLVQRKSREIQRNSLLSWGIYSKDKQKRRRQGNKLLEKWTHESKKKVFEGWHAISSEEAVFNKKIARFRSAHFRPLEQLAFKKWADLVDVKRQQEEICTERFQAYRLKMKRTSFTSWVNTAAGQERVDGTVRVNTNRFFTRRRLSQAFSTWHEEISFNHTASRKICRLQLRKTMGSWKRWCDLTKERHGIAEEMRALKQRRLLRSIVESWQDTIKQGICKKRVVSSLSKKADMRCIERALAHWIHTVSSQKAIRSLIDHHRVKNLRDTWEEWRNSLAERRALNCKEKFVIRNITSNQLLMKADVIHEWRAIKRRNKVANRMRNRLDFLMARSCLSVWSDFTETMRQRRLLVHDKASKNERNTLITSLQTWKIVYKRAIQSYGLADSMFRLRCLNTMRGYWTTWANETSRSLETLEAFEKKADVHYRNKLVARAWLDWFSFKRWNQQGRVLVEKMTSRRARIQFNRSFKEWARLSFTMSVSRIRAASMSRRHNLTLMKSTLHEWVAGVQANKEMKSNLRRCLARKRIAQKLFLSWYFDAYSSDISDSINMLFGSCDSAIDSIYHPSRFSNVEEDASPSIDIRNAKGFGSETYKSEDEYPHSFLNEAFNTTPMTREAHDRAKWISDSSTPDKSLDTREDFLSQLSARARPNMMLSTASSPISKVVVRNSGFDPSDDVSQASARSGISDTFHSVEETKSHDSEPLSRLGYWRLQARASIEHNDSPN